MSAVALSAAFLAALILRDVYLVSLEWAVRRGTAWLARRHFIRLTKQERERAKWSHVRKSAGRPWPIQLTWTQ